METVNLRKVIKRAREIIGREETSLPVKLAALDLEIASRKLLILIIGDEL